MNRRLLPLFAIAVLVAACASQQMSTPVSIADTMVEGANVALSKAGDFVTVEDAMVQTADIVASNGVVHTVDRVLMPLAKP